MQATRRPRKVALVVGDLNTPAFDPAEDDPAAQYRALAGAMDAAGFDDLWPAHGSGPGFTSSEGTVGSICRPDSAAPDLCAEPAEQTTDDRASRIDYAWLQRLRGPDRVGVAVGALRRRSFPRVPGTDGYEALPFLSDHLALHLELTVTSASPPAPTS